MQAPENAIIKHGPAEYAALCEDTALSMNVYCAVSVGTCTYDIMTTPEVFAAVAKRLEPQWAIFRNWKTGVEYVRRNPENRPPPTAGSVWRNKTNGWRFLAVNMSDDSYRDEICVVSIDGILGGRLHRAVAWLSFYREHEMIGTITSLRLE